MGDTPGGGSGSPPETVDTLGRIFLSFGSYTRRRVLEELDESEVGSLKGLAAQLDSEELGVPESRIEAVLLNVHLPRLERARLLTFDRESGEVDLTNFGSEMVEVVYFGRSIRSRYDE